MPKVWRHTESGVCGDGIPNGDELCAYACDDGNLIDKDQARGHEAASWSAITRAGMARLASTTA